MCFGFFVDFIVMFQVDVDKIYFIVYLLCFENAVASCLCNSRRKFNRVLIIVKESYTFSGPMIIIYIISFTILTKNKYTKFINLYMHRNFFYCVKSA